MLHAIAFIVMIIASYIIFAKLFEMAHRTGLIIKSIYRKFLEYRLSRIIKKEKKDKATLKERFEAKGWRIAK